MSNQVDSHVMSPSRDSSTVDTTNDGLMIDHTFPMSRGPSFVSGFSLDNLPDPHLDGDGTLPLLLAPPT